jgi:HlyD family secretion protein
MRRPRIRGVVAISAVLLLVGLLAFLLAPDPIAVDTAVVKRGPMVVTVSSEGRTRVKEQYEVVAPIAGRLLRVSLKAGDSVVAGETIIGTIEPPQPQFHDSRASAELKAKVQAADASRALAVADLERAKADLEFAKREYERNQSLSGIGAVSDRILQQSSRDAKMREAAVLIAESMVKQRVSELELAKASLGLPGAANPLEGSIPASGMVLRAPVTGRLLNVLKESESIVSPGMPLMQLGDVTQIEVMLEMLSEDAIKVREGAVAAIEGWGGRQLNARVRRIEPSGFTKISALGIEEQRVKVLLDFTDPPEAWQTLGNGYRANAKIVVWNSDNVLKVPMGALFRDGNRWASYVVVDNLAQLRHLEIDHFTDLEAEVVSGLPEGASVILHPSDRISAGTPVKPRL